MYLSPNRLQSRAALSTPPVKTMARRPSPESFSAIWCFFQLRIELTLAVVGVFKPVTDRTTAEAQCFLLDVFDPTLLVVRLVTRQERFLGATGGDHIII